MQSLTASLNDHPMALLRGIAEQCNVELTTNVRGDAAAHLAAALTEPIATNTALQACSAEARLAWEDLCSHDGHARVSAFTRSHGAIRPLGPARLERETPWRQPASPAEELWFRGLIFRGFADLGEGLLEYVYIPPELLASCREQGPAEARPPMMAPALPPKHAVFHANALVVDACTLLAALRTSPARVNAAGAVHAKDLPRLTSGLLVTDPVRFQFLLALMQQMGWLKVARGRITADVDAAAGWLRAGWWPQVTAFYEAWRESSEVATGSAGWNDLRRVPELRPEGNWRNDPLLPRRALVEALRSLPRDAWTSLGALAASIKAHNPDFQRPDGNYADWYLRDVASGRFLSGFESWDQVEGRLLRFIICGPLFWLGAVALGPEPGAAASVFRLTQSGSAWLQVGDPPDPPRPSRLVIRDETTLLAPPDLPLADRFRLLRFTEPVGEAAPGRPTQHRITRQSLAHARAEGVKAQSLLKFLAQASGSRVPPGLAAGLERWEQHSGAVRLNRGAVLRVDDAATLALIRSDPVLRPLLGDLISAQAALVSEPNLPRVLAALKELGYDVTIE